MQRDFLLFQNIVFQLEQLTSLIYCLNVSEKSKKNQDKKYDRWFFCGLSIRKDLDKQAYTMESDYTGCPFRFHYLKMTSKATEYINVYECLQALSTVKHFYLHLNLDNIHKNR